MNEIAEAIYILNFVIIGVGIYIVAIGIYIGAKITHISEALESLRR